MVKKQNVLFICRYNIFRSKLAETYFKKTNKNSNIKSKSVGIMLGGDPLYKGEIEILNEFKIKFNKKQRKLNKELLNWADLIIIVANNIPKKVIKNKINSKKVIIWRIKNTKKGDDKNKISKNVSKIIKKVDKLIKKLERIK